MKNLASVRLLLHLSQVDLALLLGRSYRTIQRLEHRQIEPSASDAQLLAALERTAKTKRPPKLKLILHQKGRVAAIRALAI